MDLKNQIKQVYAEKGLNGVNRFLKKNNIKHEVNIIHFGLNSKMAITKKQEWLNENESGYLRFHLYSVLVKAKRNGHSYNLIRGKEIILL